MQLIVKLFGLGIVVTIMDVILAQAGRKDMSYIIVIVGVLLALMMVVPEIAKVLNESIRIFGF